MFKDFDFPHICIIKISDKTDATSSITAAKKTCCYCLTEKEFTLSIKNKNEYLKYL